MCKWTPLASLLRVVVAVGANLLWPEFAVADTAAAPADSPAAVAAALGFDGAAATALAQTAGFCVTAILAGAQAAG